MTGKRRRCSAEFKAQVALPGDLRVAEPVAKHRVHRTLTDTGKRQAVEGARRGLGTGRGRRGRPRGRAGPPARQGRRVGGRARSLAESLRTMSASRRREMIDPARPRLSIARQGRLTPIGRATSHGPAKGASPRNLALMRRIDEPFLETPWRGSRRMARHPRRQAREVGRKRLRRKMARIGVRAVHRRPKTSQPHPERRVWPYLLRGLAVDRPHRVRRGDITCPPMRRGLLLPVAIMERAVGRHRSEEDGERDAEGPGLAGVEHAARRRLHRGHRGGSGAPRVARYLDTDKGGRFASPRSPDVPRDAAVRIFVDDKGRWMDRVFIERRHDEDPNQARPRRRPVRETGTTSETGGLARRRERVREVRSARGATTTSSGPAPPSAGCRQLPRSASRRRRSGRTLAPRSRRPPAPPSTPVRTGSGVGGGHVRAGRPAARTARGRLRRPSPAAGPPGRRPDRR